jgi:hypothetical protein
MTDIVYILTNPVIPDLIKIGRTTNLEERLRSLSSHSGVPVPFECYYACEVSDSQDVERRLHGAFGDHRINPKREFFRINPERVQMILEALSLNDVTPTSDVVEDEEDIETLRRANERRPVFKFSIVDVPIGAILHFIKDEAVTCTVVDEKRVDFEGSITSLSDAARTMLHRHGGKLTAAQGPLYWIYENETLTERRFRLESEDSEVVSEIR